MRDSESESTTIKVIGGCFVALIWAVALITYALSDGTDPDGKNTALVAPIAIGLSVAVWFASTYLARKSDGE